MANETAHDETSARNTALFWWVTLGGIASGISLFSLIATYLKLGLTGVGALIHDKYVQLRDDLIFDNLEQVIPLVHLSYAQRAFVLGILIFSGVVLRTYLLIRSRNRSFHVGDLYVGLLVPFIFGYLLMIVYIPIMEMEQGEIMPFIIAAIVLAASIYVVIFVRDIRIPFLTFMLNAVVCALVATLLFALGGAF